MSYSREKNKHRESHEPDNFADAAFFNGSNKSGHWLKIRCTYYRKSHKSYECNLITYRRSRMTILRAKFKCFFAYVGTTE